MLDSVICFKLLLLCVAEFEGKFTRRTKHMLIYPFVLVRDVQYGTNCFKYLRKIPLNTKHKKPWFFYRTCFPRIKFKKHCHIINQKSLGGFCTQFSLYLLCILHMATCKTKLLVYKCIKVVENCICVIICYNLHKQNGNWYDAKQDKW